MHRAAGEEDYKSHHKEPGQQTDGVEFDELGEGPEDAGRLESEVKAKGNGDHDEAGKVGLRDWRSRKHFVVATVSGNSVVKCVSGFLKGLLQKETVPHCLQKSDQFKEDYIATDCLPHWSP